MIKVFAWQPGTAWTLFFNNSKPTQYTEADAARAGYAGNGFEAIFRLANLNLVLNILKAGGGHVRR